MVEYCAQDFPAFMGEYIFVHKKDGIATNSLWQDDDLLLMCRSAVLCFASQTFQWLWWRKRE